MTSKFIPPSNRPPSGPRMPDLSLATDIVCESCSNRTFQEVLLIKKFSALVSPDGRESLAPIPTFACVACGYINQMFRPQSEPAPAPQEPKAESDRPSSLILEK